MGPVVQSATLQNSDQAPSEQGRQAPFPTRGHCSASILTAHGQFPADLLWQPKVPGAGGARFIRLQCGCCYCSPNGRRSMGACVQTLPDRGSPFPKDAPSWLSSPGHAQAAKSQILVQPQTEFEHEPPPHPRQEVLSSKQSPPLSQGHNESLRGRARKAHSCPGRARPVSVAAHVHAPSPSDPEPECSLLQFGNNEGKRISAGQCARPSLSLFCL